MRPWKSSREAEAARHGAARPDAAPLDPRCAPGRGGLSCGLSCSNASAMPATRRFTRHANPPGSTSCKPSAPRRRRRIRAAEVLPAAEAGTATLRPTTGSRRSALHTRARARLLQLCIAGYRAHAARAARGYTPHSPSLPRPPTPSATGPSRDRTTRAAGAVTRGATLDLGHRAAPRLVETAQCRIWVWRGGQTRRWGGGGGGGGGGCSFGAC